MRYPSMKPWLTTLILLFVSTQLYAQDRSPDVPNVEFARVDDSISLKLDIYLPSDKPKPYPVIVWIHGGGWHSGNKKLGRRAILLDREYAVVSIEYRLSRQALFPAQIHDCKGAIRWIRAHAEEYGFDPGRIGVYGSSAGGHLVAMLGTTKNVVELEGETGGNLEYSSHVQAVCDWYGPSNLLTIADYPSNIDHTRANSPESLLLGGTIEELPEAAWAASPIAYVDGDEPPFLIQHGTEDPAVPFHQSVELDSALREAGVDVEFQPVVGGGHGSGFEEDSVMNRMLAFFERTLLSSSGVEEATTETQHVTLYPNPAHEYITITFDKEVSGRIQLLDIIGRTITTAEIVSGESLSVEQLASGMYIVEWSSGEHVVRQMLRVQ